MGNYTSLSNRILLDVVRSHVILIAGKRGGGKCLSGDTLITLENGSQIPISELEQNNERILSLNNNLKIESSERSEFFSREVNKMIKIRLRSGKEIKLTPEHPLLTIKGWHPVENLKIGSRIATPRTLPCFGNKEMSEHEIKLLAYLIAEGHTKKIVLFANSDQKIVDDFKDSLNKFDSKLELVKEQENHYRISQPSYKVKIINKEFITNEKGQFKKENKNIIAKRSIRILIEREELFGLLSTQKFLSNNIMQLKKESLSLFLNRLFSCDGSIYRIENNGWEISYSSSSEKLIRQVHHLLIKFGILSKLRHKKINYNGGIKNSFELVLNSINVIKFIEEIGFFGVKEKRAEIAKIDVINKKINPNVDTIPKEIWEFFKPKNWADIGRKVGYKHPKAMRERIRYSPSRQTLLQIAEAEQHNGFKLLAMSDIFWDEIISIELLDGKFKVYDICVPNNHNFVANDIIVHNSYSISVISEELSILPKEVRDNIASLIFDTMGIFWTMKYENLKDAELLEEWNLKSKKLPVVVWVPLGFFEEYEKRGLQPDKKFALAVNELDIEDWLAVFELKMIEPIGILI